MKGKDPRPSEEHSRKCREYHDALLPALRIVAESCGYAIAVHGSLERDIDLVAIPWRGLEMTPEYLVEKLADVVRAVVGVQQITGPEKKPHGRQAWLINFCGHHFIDLSVMPPVNVELKL